MNSPESIDVVGISNIQNSVVSDLSCISDSVMPDSTKISVSSSNLDAAQVLNALELSEISNSLNTGKSLASDESNSPQSCNTVESYYVSVALKACKSEATQELDSSAVP